MLHRLHHVFGFEDTVLTWFQSYLENRTQIVTMHSKHSTPASLRYGVPKGSVLGPIILFYTTVSIKCHQTLSSFASSVCRWHTDLQIMHTIWNCGHNQMHSAVHFKCRDMDVLQQKLIKLKLCVCTKRIDYRTLTKINHSQQYCCCFLLRDLRITLDSSLSFNQQVMNICRSALYELRWISSIWEYCTIDATKTIVWSSSLKAWLL